MEEPSVKTVLRMFKKLPRPQQIAVAEKINKQTLKERWDQMDKFLPDTDLSEVEIMQELMAVRYGKKG